jgi:transcriptional regulator with AAA-type ATPase domain
MNTSNLFDNSEFVSFLVGYSPKLLEAINIIQKISDTPTNVLIFGESGTGKELAARMIHSNSTRKNDRFVDLNCAALPEGLLESELFGIEKGVATGVEKREGKIELSNGGTLLLDEIGDLSLNAQAKLLRVIQEKKLRRVGGKSNLEIDLRVIASTNKNLVDEIKNGNFREDLYYRLNEVNIKMPPLRELREDIKTLCEYFLENFENELRTKKKNISKEAMDYLVNYNWPGNIRELKNEIKRVSILSEANTITSEDLSSSIKQFFTNKQTDDEKSKSLKDAVTDLEKTMIVDALEESNGNKQKASKILGVTRQGLTKKIKRYGLDKYISRPRSERISEKIYTNKFFVGRENESDLIKKLINSDKQEFYVVFIHGIGGIGKTHLIKKVLNEINSNINSIYLDCRDIEPTEIGFLESLSDKALIDLNGEKLNLSVFINKLEKLDHRTVIVLDSYEKFNLLDTWIRNDFILSLPSTVKTIIISRQSPNISWFTNSNLGTFVKEIEIEELSYEESLNFLKSKGVSTIDSENIYKLVHGHPLALDLTTRIIKNFPETRIEYESFPKVFNKITKVFLEGLDNPNLRECIESVSPIRRFDESLLKFIHKNTNLDILLNDLVELPFITLSSEGYVMHELVRENVARDLLMRDPERYNEYKNLAFKYLSDRSKQIKKAKLWQLTADLLYLIENPIVRDAFFPKDSSDYAVEYAKKNDIDNILKITSENEPGDVVNIYKSWWDELPTAFKVVRNILNEVEAFIIICEPDEINNKLITNDRITGLWLSHLESNPVEKAEKVLFLRRWLSKGYGELPCSAQAASWLDVKRDYMELRPYLRRVYTTINDVNTYAPIVTPLGFKIIDDYELNIGSSKYFSAMLDFGPDSVDGWLRNLIGVELKAV